MRLSLCYIFANFLYPKEMKELTTKEQLSLKEIIKPSVEELGIKNIIEAVGLEKIEIIL